MKREQIPGFVSRIVGLRPVRWLPPEQLAGDYDGRERTLQVFDADAPDQRRLLAIIDEHRAMLEEAAGGPLVVIFHSVRQSKERYGDVLRSFFKPIAAPRNVVPPAEKCVDAEEKNGPHRRIAA